MCQEFLRHAQISNDTLSVTDGYMTSNGKQTRGNKRKLSFYKSAELRSSIYVLIRVYGERSRTVHVKTLPSCKPKKKKKRLFGGQGD